MKRLNNKNFKRAGKIVLLSIALSSMLLYSNEIKSEAVTETEEAICVDMFGNIIFDCYMLNNGQLNDSYIEGLNLKTDEVIDIATFDNLHSMHLSQSDFKKSIVDTVTNDLPETKGTPNRFIELDVTQNEKRQLIKIDENDEYSNKLKYLIENNIVTRDSTYRFTPKENAIEIEIAR